MTFNISQDTEFMAFNRPECDFAIDKKSLQHQRMANHWRRFRCDICSAQFTRKDNFNRHMDKHTNIHNVHCHNVAVHLVVLTTYNIRGGAKRPSDTQEDYKIKRLKTDDDPRQYYVMKKIKEQKMEKFRTTSSIHQEQFRNIDVNDVTNILNTLKRVFAAILEDVTSHSNTEDLIRMTVQSPSLDYPIVIPFLRLHEVTLVRFLSEGERILQSNEDFVIDEGLELDITHVDMANGSGRQKRTIANMDRHLKEKQCIIRIKQ
ncbi:hypothetical protein MAR_016917 [Mya arenaria]|uniref:C2H2-type domain-containing protein n=1 Tax=Mya arenaria TaxID=6604 RepID=A0ABY7ECS2_MYAAR|nr:hypothetical protein MAR_016917 [Mya arenaria]